MELSIKTGSGSENSSGFNCWVTKAILSKSSHKTFFIQYSLLTKILILILLKLFILCIVSIFSESPGNFILTQNRDESILRPSSDNFQTRKIHGCEYTGPVDLVSEGTWIYYAENFVCCILNGGYENHSHRPPYRMSRGLIILELLKYNSIDEFMEAINLDGIEPFTMVMLNRYSDEKKILVWDELKKHREDLSGQNLIARSSSTLYSESEKEIHRRAFENLTNKSQESIFDLQEELKMLENKKYPTVQSTSITQIIQTENLIKLKFCPISI